MFLSFSLCVFFLDFLLLLFFFFFSSTSLLLPSTLVHMLSHVTLLSAALQLPFPSPVFFVLFVFGCAESLLLCGLFSCHGEQELLS